MASDYRVLDIKKVIPDQERKYFFDANVWMFILDPSFKVPNYYQPYIDFFEAVLNLSQTTGKRLIAINNLVISEFTNVYLKNTLSDYNEFNRGELKLKEFRAMDEYDTAVQHLRTDLKGYIDSFSVFKEDKVDTLDVLNTFPANSDFNDYYYYEMAIENDLALVTHDKDFLFAGVEIITNQKKLLRL